ncbi:hypothetical protein IFR05_015481 [Cadophora sp. M221]|nr:hypothetical protein IFR05_015481 [Cadophora sp. M221]
MVQINDTIQNNMANQTTQARAFLKPATAVLPSDPLTSIVLIGAAFLVVRSILALTSRGIKAPYAGYRSMFEPAFLVRLRFSKGALPQIDEGYRKFKNSFFKVSRNDKDILVISNKYLDELRNLPEEKLNSMQALIENIVGKYSQSEIMLEGNLHTRILQTKLTPTLANLTSIMKEEVDEAILRIKAEYAVSDDWAEIPIYKLMTSLINQISNRIFLGEVDGRNEEWCRASLAYAENVTATIMIVRCFPLWIRPLAALFVPSVWRVDTHLRAAKNALIPVINRRREAEKTAGYQKPNDFLQWMMDGADAEEGRPEKLAHRQLILILASLHTTSMAATHAFFDLCAHPEYFEPLRDEVRDVVRDEGGWAKTTLSKMRKTDSFLKESQRLNPASLSLSRITVGFHRIVKEPLTLSDGTYLPTNTHLCVASEAISKDPSFAPNASDFDGLRYFRKRQAAEEANKHQFSMTDKTHVHFGHGKFACPGRFFAANELKLILARLIEEFDFKYPEGQTRPDNLNVDEFLYSDPARTLLMRRRIVLDAK